MARRTLEEITSQAGPIAVFVREKRKLLSLTQEELAFRSGVGTRFLKELERGKITVQLDKVNLVLKFFGHELIPAPIPRDIY